MRFTRSSNNEQSICACVQCCEKALQGIPLSGSKVICTSKDCKFDLKLNSKCSWSNRKCYKCNAEVVNGKAVGTKDSPMADDVNITIEEIHVLLNRDEILLVKDMENDKHSLIPVEVGNAFDIKNMDLSFEQVYEPVIGQEPFSFDEKENSKGFVTEDVDNPVSEGIDIIIKETPAIMVDNELLRLNDSKDVADDMKTIAEEISGEKMPNDVFPADFSEIHDDYLIKPMIISKDLPIDYTDRISEEIHKDLPEENIEILKELQSNDKNKISN